MKRILVIAAHPDDEVLGCGGAIYKHASNDDDVRVLILSDGVGARFSGPSKAAEAQCRQKIAEMEKAHAILKVVATTYATVAPDNQFDTVPMLKIVKEIRAVIERIEPAIVYTHHCGDLNIDHRIVGEATLVATRPLLEQSYAVGEVYAYEVPEATALAFRHDFRPNTYVSIDVKKKVEALQEYDSERRSVPHPRSVDSVWAVAQVRGSEAGFLFAEAFQLIRRLM